jgi:hypothetical protein
MHGICGRPVCLWTVFSPGCMTTPPAAVTTTHSDAMIDNRAPVAQWIEQVPSKHLVAGSIPAGRAIGFFTCKGARSRGPWGLSTALVCPSAANGREEREGYRGPLGRRKSVNRSRNTSGVAGVRPPDSWNPSSSPARLSGDAVVTAP